MELDGGANINIADAIAIGKTKSFLIGNVGGDTLEAAASHGVVTGIHQGYFPRFGFLVMHFHAVIGHVKGDVGHVQEVVSKVLFDDVALVAAADDKVVHAMGGIPLKNVPKDGLATHFDHGFGFEVGFFGYAGAQATGQDDGFHVLSL